mmetsp:Transcript_20494/g.51939  ORF Transcript_20494/g.51939 Transcript_20494/m.51939 type:complete len:200 (-) Transcript_20494:756-1355(-)
MNTNSQTQSVRSRNDTAAIAVPARLAWRRSGSAGAVADARGSRRLLGRRGRNGGSLGRSGGASHLDLDGSEVHGRAVVLLGCGSSGVWRCSGAAALGGRLLPLAHLDLEAHHGDERQARGDGVVELKVSQLHRPDRANLAKGKVRLLDDVVQCRPLGGILDEEAPDGLAESVRAVGAEGGLQVRDRIEKLVRHVSPERQ